MRQNFTNQQKKKNKNSYKKKNGMAHKGRKHKKVHRK